jgi:hypothetical protein
MFVLTAVSASNPAYRLPIDKYSRYGIMLYVRARELRLGRPKSLMPTGL